MGLPRDRRCGPTWRRLPRWCRPGGADQVVSTTTWAPLSNGQRAARQPRAAAASSMLWTRGGGASTRPPPPPADTKPEHSECCRIFTKHGQKLCAPRHCDTSTVNTSHGTVATSCSGPHPHPPPGPASKNGPFVESSLWGWLVVAVILHLG